MCIRLGVVLTPKCKWLVKFLTFRPLTTFHRPNVAAKAYTSQYVSTREKLPCFSLIKEIMEMGFPSGEKYIQKVQLDAFPGTQNFLVCQSHVKFVED